jgi:UPF0755 protein
VIKTTLRKVLSSILAKLTTFVNSMMLLFNFIFFFVIVSAAVAGFFAFDYFKSPGPLLIETNVIIPEGTPLQDISAILSKNNVIKYPEIFTFIMRFSESERKLKAGEYAFDEGISPLAAFHKMVAGDVVIHRFTVAEGLMNSQVLKIIENIDILSGEIPKNIKEGSLLPETYDYTYGETRAKVIKRMQDAMAKALADAWEARQRGLPITTPDEALVLASIIEKETSLKSERERVAAVFINRLNKKMRLQTDPTVIYAVTGGQYVLDRPLTGDDLKTDSPFNTYKNLGLPPTPISNPGKASIIAALNPLTTDELYFVADGTGGHTFSSALKDHNKGVSKLRKNEKKKGKKK